jgi:hypothetical protein
MCLPFHALYHVGGNITALKACTICKKVSLGNFGGLWGVLIHFVRFRIGLYVTRMRVLVGAGTYARL